MLVDLSEGEYHGERYSVNRLPCGIDGFVFPSALGEMTNSQDGSWTRTRSASSKVTTSTLNNIHYVIIYKLVIR